ncbi:MAG TPA: AMP-binding protein, partial [Acidimicrobiales bacterium]|nr:AMP-binding protein [Acidimicrobiales bacterium]
MRKVLASLEMAGAAGMVFARTGMLGPHRPDHLLGYARAVRRWGLTMGASYALTAVRAPSTAALIDEDGAVSFAEMDERTSTAACALADLGVGPRSQVGLLSRNHRGFLTAVVALAKLGADTVYLNTGFAGPQLAQVAERERVEVMILDAEFVAQAGELAKKVPLVVADGPAGQKRRRRGVKLNLPDVVAGDARPGPPAPGRIGAQIILTSGTTGAPKGAQRQFAAREVEPLVSLLSRIPLRMGDTTMIAAPMFHSWGLVNMAFGLMLGATLVLSRRFDPEDALRRIERHRVSALIAVPVMLQRLMDLPADVRRRYDTSSLRLAAVSGSALPGELANRFMDEFGDILYNMYGSTEIGWVTIADPTDLRASPGTAGRPPVGTRVRLLDPDGRQVAAGETGRIFVRSGLQFEGYTGGGSKDVVDGFMSTGDVGHFDAGGRLFVDGRDDDMIVSGGENVFPREVEELLMNHPAVEDAAVIGVDDDKYGQRLKAFVVTTDGERVDAEDIKGYVREHLARYKVPRDVEFMDELPRNATGKV